MTDALEVLARDSEDPIVLAYNAALARLSLADWFTRLNPTYTVEPWQAQVIEALERVERGECKRLMLSVPPQHGKSELVSIAFLSWYLGRNPGKEVMLASYGAALAYRHSRRARNAFVEHGPAVFGLNISSESASVSTWGLDEVRGAMNAVGVDGPATGMGYSLGVIDDPIKGQQEADSELIRENVRDWYRSVFRTRARPGAAIIVVQTRWHEDDLTGWLLREAKAGSEQWEVLNLPFYDDSKPLPEAILSPRHWGEYGNPEGLAKLKAAAGSRTWEALYQGRPSPQEGGILKRTWWKTYGDDPRKVPCDLVIQSWDMAFKDTKTSDFVVGQVWGKRGASFYLLDQIRGRMDAPATIRAVKLLSARWPQATLKLVEDAANGTAVIQLLRGVLEGVVAVKPDGGKESRAAAVSPMIEAGNVYLPMKQYAPWIDDFVEECTAFPTGAHDDQVDSMSQGLNRLRRMAGSIVSPTGRPSGLPRVDM